MGYVKLCVVCFADLVSLGRCVPFLLVCCTFTNFVFFGLWL